MCKRIFVLFVIHSFLLQAGSDHWQLTSVPGVSLMPTEDGFVPCYEVFPVYGGSRSRSLFVPVVEPKYLVGLHYLTSFQRVCIDGSIADVKKHLENYGSLTFPTERGAFPLQLVLESQRNATDRLTVCDMFLQEAQKRDQNITSLVGSNDEAPFITALKRAKNNKEELGIADLILDHTDDVKILNAALGYFKENQKKPSQKINAEYVCYFVNKINDKFCMQKLHAYIAQLTGAR